jgi:hypothetical protein
MPNLLEHARRLQAHDLKARDIPRAMEAILVECASAWCAKDKACLPRAQWAVGAAGALGEAVEVEHALMLLDLAHKLDTTDHREELKESLRRAIVHSLGKVKALLGSFLSSDPHRPSDPLLGAIGELGALAGVSIPSFHGPEADYLSKLRRAAEEELVVLRRFKGVLTLYEDEEARAAHVKATVERFSAIGAKDLDVPLPEPAQVSYPHGAAKEAIEGATKLLELVDG